MTTDSHPPQKPGSADKAKTDPRVDALRNNLQKRKQQMRARKEETKKEKE